MYNKEYYEKNKEKINKYFTNYMAKKRKAKRDATKKICPVCNKEFTPTHRINQKYCSAKCRIKQMEKNRIEKYRVTHSNK